MKKGSVLLITLIALSFTQAAKSQTTRKTFTGAEATLKNYKALYELNSGDTKNNDGHITKYQKCPVRPSPKGKTGGRAHRLR